MPRIMALLLCLPLSGCWFVFIPGSLISAVSDTITGDAGEHCVARGAYIGQKIRMPDGRIGTVQQVSSSASSRCAVATPIRAVLTPDP